MCAKTEFIKGRWGWHGVGARCVQEETLRQSMEKGGHSGGKCGLEHRIHENLLTILQIMVLKNH